MKDYILSIACAGIVSGIIGTFSGFSSTSRYIKLVVSLCFISSVIPGTVSIIENLPSYNKDFGLYDSFAFEKAEEKYLDYVIADTRKNLCQKLNDMIFEKTGIIPDETNIQLDVAENKNCINVEIASVEIISAELAKRDGVSEYIKGITGKIPVILPERRNNN